MPPQLLEVGRIQRSHGLVGELIVDLTTTRLERVARGAKLFAGPNLVPLVVLKARPQNAKWLVFFEGVIDRNGSDALRNLYLFAEPIDDPDEIWVHEVVGREVVDQHGVNHGPIEAVQDMPAPGSDLLVLESGGLIPMDFVVEIDEDDIVRVEIPDGLFDINESS